MVFFMPDEEEKKKKLQEMANIRNKWYQALADMLMSSVTKREQETKERRGRLTTSEVEKLEFLRWRMGQKGTLQESLHGEED